MKPMDRLLALSAAGLLCLGSIGCGPGDASGGPLAFELFVDQATPTPIASWQVALMSQGSRSDCAQLQTSCLHGQVTKDRLVRLTDSKGAEHPAIAFPASAPSGGTQDVGITAAVGTDYKLIIEALSADATPQLLGTSCTPLPEGIRSGTNKAVLAEPLKLFSPPLTCDPRWE